MNNAWMVVVMTSAAGVLVRELFRLVRYVLRRASMERIAARIVFPGSRLVDQDENGARFELTVERPQPQPPTADTGQDKERVTVVQPSETQPSAKGPDAF